MPSLQHQKLKETPMKEEQVPRLEVASMFLDQFEKLYKLIAFFSYYLIFLKKEIFPSHVEKGLKKTEASQGYLKPSSFIPWGDRSLEGGRDGDEEQEQNEKS